MRAYCTVEGYTDDFVDFDERWSRAEIRKFGSSSADTIDLMRIKITDLKVTLMDGVLVKPEDITEETLDRMQWEVFQWFITLPQLVVRGVLDLGEAVRRQSLRTQEESQALEDSAKQELTPTS